MMLRGRLAAALKKKLLLVAHHVMRYSRTVSLFATECLKMKSRLRKCSDGFWRPKFKSTRRAKRHPEPKIVAEAALPKCFYCGKPAGTKDHVIPRSRGGRGPNNKVHACKRCNQIKGDRTLEEYRSAMATALQKPIEQIVFYREVHPR